MRTCLRKLIGPHQYPLTVGPVVTEFEPETSTRGNQTHGCGRCFFIFSSIQILKMGTFEKFRKQILSCRNKKHDQKRKKNTSDRDPGYPKTSKQVNRLENREKSDSLERHGFNKCSMIFFQNPD
ncbi:hypothetical protein Hanom_Chr08g00734211 [Helianthus anomalus]